MHYAGGGEGGMSVGVSHQWGRWHLVARETTGAALLLRAFFKGSEVKKTRT